MVAIVAGCLVTLLELTLAVLALPAAEAYERAAREGTTAERLHVLRRDHLILLLALLFTYLSPASGCTAYGATPWPSDRSIVTVWAGLGLGRVVLSDREPVVPLPGRPGRPGCHLRKQGTGSRRAVVGTVVGEPPRRTGRVVPGAVLGTARRVGRKRVARGGGGHCAVDRRCPRRLGPPRGRDLEGPGACVAGAPGCPSRRGAVGPRAATGVLRAEPGRDRRDRARAAGAGGRRGGSGVHRALGRVLHRLGPGLRERRATSGAGWARRHRQRGRARGG